MSYHDEFQTIDLLQDQGCQAETRGVDAFALAVIKAERQQRKLFTYLIYQYPCFDDTHITALRDALASKLIFFDGLVRGVDAVSPIKVAAMIGVEFPALWQSLD